MIFSLYRILLGVLVLIAISGFLTLTSSEYGPTLRGHMSQLYPFPGAAPSSDDAGVTFGYDEDKSGYDQPYEIAEHEWETNGGDHDKPQMPKGWGDGDYPDVDEGVNTYEDPPIDGSYKDGIFEELQDEIKDAEAVHDGEPTEDAQSPANVDHLPPDVEPWQAEVLNALDEEDIVAPATPSTSTSTAASTATSTATSTSTASSDEQRFIFAFGDSLTALGFSMEGEKPSHGNPFGNPPFPGHTSSGGPNWLDDLILESPEDTLCYNFATGAAVVDVNIVHPMLSLIPFPYQVANFTSKLGIDPHPAFANWTADNSLAIVWLGVNDVSAMQVYTNDATPTNLTNRIMVSYFEKVGQLYDVGLRKFVFMGVPPLYRFPFSIKDGEPYEHGENLTFSCKYWNEALQLGTDEFKNSYSGVEADVVLVDPFFNEVIDSPAEYGALNATCTAEDGTSCLWVDGLHPGVEIARKVGAGIHAFIDQTGFFA